MELLTVHEAAQTLRVSLITVRRYIASGKLRAVRAGKGVRVHRESLEQFITPVEPREGEPGPVLPRGKALSSGDPLWELVGSATDAEPTDASKKYEYLAEALAPTRP